MKRLVICEDEKMIRQGIKSIVMRSSVSFEEIFMCKNGEEAYEIIANNKIDLLITDIRMPKMDGITLVKEIQKLPYVPKVVVISGYDDFSYAVELLKFGAKEYILKPIERDKLFTVLEKLEEESKEERTKQEGLGLIGLQQLKYILLNTNITDEEIEKIEKKFGDYLYQDEYVVFCTNHRCEYEQGDILQSIIYLEDIKGQCVYIVKAEEKEKILMDLFQKQYVGVSRRYNTVRMLREAYREAFASRKTGYVRGEHIIEFYQLADKVSSEENESVESEMIDQLVQKIGTDKLEEVNRFLRHLLYKAKQGRISSGYLEEFMILLVENISSTYKNLIDFEEDGSWNLENIYSYNNVESYIETILSWMENINKKLLGEFTEYKNKEKIKKAILYIQENYSSNLNMAVVSNHISMNYSLFSSLFKKLVGMNFVAYIKNIRINEAKRLLEYTDMKVIEVSNAIGYENERNFMRVFKSVCGVSPSEYRKNVQVGKQERPQ